MALKDEMQKSELWKIFEALKISLPQKIGVYPSTTDHHHQITDEMRALAILLLLGETHHNPKL